MKKYPNHYVALRKNDNNSVSIIYYRNNLSENIFKFTSGEFFFCEKYKKKDYVINLKIKIKSDNIKEMFYIKDDHFVIKGKINNFGIKIISTPILPQNISKRTIKRVNHLSKDFALYCELSGMFNNLKTLDFSNHNSSLLKGGDKVLDYNYIESSKNNVQKKLITEKLKELMLLFYRIIRNVPLIFIL